MHEGDATIDGRGSGGGACAAGPAAFPAGGDRCAARRRGSALVVQADAGTGAAHADLFAAGRKPRVRLYRRDCLRGACERQDGYAIACWTVERAAAGTAARGRRRL